MGDISAQQETLFRWDNEERVLQACTTDPRVAVRWKRAELPVVVMSKDREGEPRTWSVDLSWAGQKRPWITVFSTAIPQWDTEERSETGVE